MTPEDRKTIKRYLAQYHTAKERKAVLQKRARTLRSDLSRSDKSGEIEYKIAEIESRLQRQAVVEAGAVLNVMDMIDFLPPGSTERQILELRHIDLKSWNEIQRIVHLTRSPCNEYYNRGLEALLGFKKVRQMLGKFERQMARIEKDGW